MMVGYHCPRCDEVLTIDEGSMSYSFVICAACGIATQSKEWESVYNRKQTRKELEIFFRSLKR